MTGMRPPQRPVYDPPAKIHGGFLSQVRHVDLVENLFFGVAMVFSFLFAVALLFQARLTFVSLLYLLGFWAVMSYLALPRLHRVLSALYLPDYFIGRTRAADGMLGDPINLAFNGDEQQIRRAMHNAGWVEADPIDLTASVRMVIASLTKRSYTTAPVSPLFLFNRQQAFAFQQEVKGSPSQRHHVRFWPCPPGWKLPGGHEVGWLAAGTYDRSVGLSLFTFQFTHKIDRDIDIERDYIIETLRYADQAITVRVIKDFSTGYHGRNGGGDLIVTDGDLPIVDVRAVEPRPVPVRAPRMDLAHEVGRRPFSVVAAFALTLISTVGSLIAGGIEVARSGSDIAEVGLSGVASVVVAFGLVAFVMLFLAWRTYEGGEVARLIMLVMLSLTLGQALIATLTGDHPAAWGLVNTGTDLLTIYALTSRSARGWTATRRTARREKRLACGLAGTAPVRAGRTDAGDDDAGHGEQLDGPQLLAQDEEREERRDGGLHAHEDPEQPRTD